MTAPTAGKLPLDAEVYLNDLTLDEARVCIHRKGFARATVTHLDIEHPSFSGLIPSEHGRLAESQALRTGY